MAEEDALRRWMAFELHRLNDAVVLARVPLSDLARQAEPRAPTRSGGVHAFDAAALAEMKRRLPILLHHRLLLPITFYEPHDVAGDAYVEDAAAIEALQALGEATTTPRAGRRWMSRPLGARLRQRWPTLVQSLHA